MKILHCVTTEGDLGLCGAVEPRGKTRDLSDVDCRDCINRALALSHGVSQSAMKDLILEIETATREEAAADLAQTRHRGMERREGYVRSD